MLKANGKGFCSGHAIGNNSVDYPEFVEGFKATGTPWKPQSDLFVKPILNLWEFSKPTIAQIHGYCVGGGTHYGLDHRYRHRLRGCLLLLSAPAGVRHAIG